MTPRISHRRLLGRAHAPAPAAEPSVAAPEDAALPAPAAAGKPGWRERLRNSTFARSFGGLF